MDHDPHAPHDHADAASASGGSVSRIALLATTHCLLGCAIGEVAGMVIGTALGWSTAATMAGAIVLAFVSGFALTAVPLVRGGQGVGGAVRVALAADTVSITLMEIVDNALMLVIPGAMGAPLDTRLFWGSLLASLVLAGLAAYPVNRWLIARGAGHARVHASR